MKPVKLHDWQLSGEEPMTRAQQNLLNAACGDLAAMPWKGGHYLSQDDYRHILTAMVLSWRIIPGMDMGDGQPSMIVLPRSSKELSKSKATEAIQLAFCLGDDPSQFGIDAMPVQWSQVVRLARSISDSDEELSRRFAA